MNVDKNKTKQSEESENRMARKFMIDSSLSSCPEHPELPLIRLSFDYFPSQPESSIIRFKCEKCCLQTTNDSEIFLLSKWFEFEEFTNYQSQMLKGSKKIEQIAFQQFLENFDDKLDKTDKTILLPIIDEKDQMYNPSDVRNELYLNVLLFQDPIIDQIKPDLGEIAFESSTNLKDKQKQLENFSRFYKYCIEILELRLMELIRSHRQLKNPPELQPPLKLRQERIEIWSQIFGENQANLFKRLLTQSDSIQNLTLDLRSYGQNLHEKDCADVAAILPLMTSLKRLNLSLPQNNFSGEYCFFARGIAQVTNLTHLVLQLEFGEVFAAMIGSLKYLEHLKLYPSNSLLTRDFYDIKLAFFHSNQLKTLDINLIKRGQLNTIKLNNLISAITQQTQLVELSLEIEIEKIEDSGFICFEEMFQKLKFLEKLKLGIRHLQTQAGAFKIVIGSLVHIQKLTHLRIYLFEFSEVVLGSLNLVLPSLKLLESLCLTLKDTYEHNDDCEYATEGKPIELLRFGSNLSHLQNLKSFKLFYLSNRLNLEDQELFGETVFLSSRNQINFSSLKVCLLTYINNSYQSILSQQFVNKIQQIENLEILNLLFRSNEATKIFETFSRIQHLKHLKLRITEGTEIESCLTAIQSSIRLMTNLSSFKLTIINSDLRDMSLISLVESIRKLQNNLLYFKFSLLHTKWRNLQKGQTEITRRFQSMKKLTDFKIKHVA